MTQHRLTMRQIATLKATGGKQVLNDGAGLRLIVEPNGNKRWVLRRMVDGKDTDKGLGGFPAVSLKEARETADKIRQGIALPVRRIEPAVALAPDEGVTFEQAAMAYYVERDDEWRLKPKKARDWLGRMKNHAFPRIGHIAMSDLTDDHLHAVLHPLWKTKSASANNLRDALVAVLKRSKRKGLCSRDLVDAVGDVCKELGRQPPQKPHAAIDVEILPAFMRDLDSMNIGQPLRLCMWFITLTAKRSGDAREAEWTEYNEATGVWTIPAARLKFKDRGDHPEPLSDAARHILRLAKQAAGNSRYMFPNPVTGHPYTDKSLSLLTKPHGITVHGMRATMRSWAAGETVDINGTEIRKHQPDVIELALAHKAYGDVEGVYQRNPLIKMRLTWANDWAKVVLGGRPAPMLQLAA